MEQDKKKYRENCDKFATGILVICYLVTFILIIIWLFKLHNNARSEPYLELVILLMILQLIIQKKNFVMKIMNPLLFVVL